MAFSSLYKHVYPYMRNEIATILKKRMLRARKRSSGVLKENIGYSIPEDLLTETLSRLPVKTLLQFKVVCKSWYAIIKSPSFITKHLKNYYRNNDDSCECLIAQFPITQAGELKTYELLLDYKVPKLLLACENIDHRMDFNNTFLYGPCDGLYYYRPWFEKDGRYLWNPILNEKKKLPSLLKSSIFPSYYKCPGYYYIPEYYGFGHDPLANDYKVIIIKNCIDTRIHKDWSSSSEEEHMKYFTSIFIYSLRNDSWRHWGDLNGEYHMKREICYIYVNDSVYWLASKDKCRDYYHLMVGFNLVTDEFQEWQLPNDEKVDYYALHSLAVCYNSVALLIEDRQQGMRDRFVLWSFNEGTWTKKHTIDLNCDKFDNDYSRPKPLGHWKDNKLLFYKYCRTIVLYDLETQETWDLETPDGFGCDVISAYKESLVSLWMWEKQDENTS